MGIELPPELATVAATAGVRWPAADEDRMRDAAAAWRRAADQVTGAGAAADGAANTALAGLSGDTGDAARAHWTAVADPDHGSLATAVQGAHAAADRLEHAAGQIGAAKVEIVRHLTSLAHTTDALHTAAAAGHGDALAAADTAIRGTAANVAAVHETLTRAVGGDPDAVVGAVTPPVPSATDGWEGPSIADSAKEPAGLVSSTVDTPPSGFPVLGQHGHGGFSLGQQGHGGFPVGDPGHGGLPVGQPGHGGLVGPPDHGGFVGPPGHGGPVSGGVPAGPGAPDPGGYPGGQPGHGGFPVGQPNPAGHPGPVGHGPSTVDGGFAGDPSDTGPLPLPDTPRHLPALHPGQQAGTVAASAAAPVDVPPGVITPRAGIPPQAPPPPSVAPQPLPDVAGAQPGFAGPPANRPLAGAAGVAANPLADGGSRSGVVADGTARPAAAGTGRPGAVDPPVVGGTGRPGVADNAGRSGAPNRQPGADGTAQPGGAAAPGSDRSRKRGDEAMIALFRAQMFPIGHLPKPRQVPLRQLPAPDRELDFAPGLRFPPQDHPRSHLVTDEATTPHRAPSAGLPHDLADGHDPLGDLHERDWDRRFLVRAAGAQPAEYAWPPGEMHPEGGCDHGEPMVLEPGTELDRFGTEEGRVFGTPGTPFAHRALPPDMLAEDYRRYRVLRPLPVWWAVSAPWFGQPGGGARYRTTYPAADLVALGYLEPHTPTAGEHG